MSKTITISISDATYQYIAQKAKSSVEFRTAAIVELAVEAQQELKKFREQER